ncbi:hypothetical protein KKC08_01305 [Patescibacteria group bacterium]|nr:hypothetical protein [Patescibacteria group bacterium]MCG2702554.1 hypothetical protein [Candidatus Parcubacteria bacterium]MBU4265096.1 hypothetical protein [Patescibacteria group bacterium]MBU4389664.1 hypothetical protein [Patescibacteria group bacterium]MBU4396790.1 hypothetical protein [Patescibacteria group bacterium]
MVLITRPNHDLATRYLYHFSKKVVDYCQKKSISLVDLKGKKANRKLFLSYVKKGKLKFVFVNGHGNDDIVCGYDNEVIVDKYEKDFKKTIFYCRSCRSAKILGKKLVKGGISAFVGYTKDYYVLMSRKKNTNPLSDKTARLFLDPSNLVAMSILKGDNVGEADKKSKKLLKKNIKEVIGSKMRFKDDVVAYLLHDLKAQVVIGDKSAKL